MLIADTVRAFANGAVQFNGITMRATALNADVEAYIRRLMPQPTPPNKPTPGRGVVTMKPDPEDPGYQKRLSEWALRYACVELAVACDLEPEKLGAFDSAWVYQPAAESEAKAKAWLDAVAAEMMRTATRRAIELALDQLRDLERDMVLLAYAHQRGVDPDDLDAYEANECRKYNVSASTDTLGLATELAQRYRPERLAEWWDSMPVGHRAVLVAIELVHKIDAEVNRS